MFARDLPKASRGGRFIIKRNIRVHDSLGMPLIRHLPHEPEKIISPVKGFPVFDVPSLAHELQELIHGFIHLVALHVPIDQFLLRPVLGGVEAQDAFNFIYYLDRRW